MTDTPRIDPSGRDEEPVVMRGGEGDGRMAFVEPGADRYGFLLRFDPTNFREIRRWYERTDETEEGYPVFRVASDTERGF